MFHRRSGRLFPSRKAVPQGALNLIYAVRALDVFLYAICQDANPLLRRTGIRADLSQSLVRPVAGRKRKWPRKTRAIGLIHRGQSGSSDRACSRKPCI
jgi:hypothetical protein